MDLADDVEEQVVGLAHGGDQAGDVPTALGERGGDELALRLRVAEGVDGGFLPQEDEEPVWFTDAMADWSDQDRSDLGRLLGKLADDVIARLALLDDAPPPAT
ncbi:hypothetical protein [Kitasatospora sp. NPDC087314]|uniref:hypothetical protein n=1 Tax=Kitasatospora sp. NPDC087314 TaxID=3364068 RepID=UPI003828195F